VQVTIFDPDLDPTGTYASELVTILSSALQQLGAQIPDGDSP
jgi:hypothetical protein